MQDFSNAMLRNNPATGNFGTLMVLTTRVVEEVRLILDTTTGGTLVKNHPSPVEEGIDRPYPRALT